MKRIENAPNFKKAFCAHFGCRPEDFARKALFRFFYPHALPIGYVLYWLRTVSIVQALEAVEQFGNAMGADEIDTILVDYHYQLSMHRASSFIGLFKIRISGRRVLNLFRLLESNLGARAQKKIPKTEVEPLEMAHFANCREGLVAPVRGPL